MDEHLKATPQSGIWGNRNYRFFLTAALISSPGYFIYIIAVEWLMLTIYESRSYLGMMLFASTFARLLFTIYGGIIADRLNRKLVVLISQWSEFLLIASILTCYLTDTLTPIFLIIVSFLFGIMDAFSGPAHSSMIVSITDKDSLQRANGLLRMAGQYSLIIGPLIGSTLIISIGFTGVFLFCMAMLLISSLLIACVRTPPQQVESTRSTTPWEDFRASLAYVRGHRILPITTGIGFLMNFFIAGPMGVMIPIMARDILQGSAFVLACLQISLGIGFILGALTTSLCKTFVRPGLMMLCFLAVVVLGYSALGFIHQFALAVCALFAIGYSIQLSNIPIFTYIQKTTEARMLGKVTAIMTSVSTALTPLSLALMSYLLHLGVELQSVVRVYGICLILITAGAFCITPLRTLTDKTSTVQQANTVHEDGVST
ncbi:MFS transporter [Paenibacillus thiaminolyticus]|nr:MFS transporter [Paenibacillus thiaminolyticus]MCY9533437.1 MFS transporter [Paenibacillus thiaminolyticus]MCY9604102.1 MFS transporter [Paenibacillus thiaminolyticus]MCY9606350.1 MFS transporter [Paenibacillus thiaminolyticus]MCY9612100.1 MFS transporter [Paenibacillus thiaminolyticus]MCY9618121.1 MFS transporter [Paenibacillus thiaminolyticus]